MLERQVTPDSTHRRGSDATPLDPSITSPHISNKVVSLSLSDNNNRNLVLTEVRLEAISLVVHMERSRPNRHEFHRMLYASFAEEINNVLDIHFMGKRCYYSEFTDPSSVSRLLEIKNTSLSGAWISFYK